MRLTDEQLFAMWVEAILKPAHEGSMVRAYTNLQALFEGRIPIDPVFDTGQRDETVNTRAEAVAAMHMDTFEAELRTSEKEVAGLQKDNAELEAALARAEVSNKGSLALAHSWELAAREAEAAIERAHDVLSDCPYGSEPCRACVDDARQLLQAVSK